MLGNDDSPTSVSWPVSLAVDSDKGVLFWLDRGKGASSSKLARAGLDGSRALVLVSSDLTQLDHLALDVGNQRVYFSESAAGRITSITYDGQDRHYVLADPTRAPLGLAFFSGQLFYSDAAFDSVQFAPITSDGQPPQQWTSFKKDIDQLVNIKLFTPRVNSLSHPCKTDNGNCQHLCIPTQFSQRVCLCATGYTLDGTTKCKLFDQTFLLVASKTRITGIP